MLRSDNTLQGQVIATQAFNFSRYNQVAEHANRLNSLIDISTEETVIEYREILRREKTCDLPVPADIAGGLLEYAHSLRASAMYTDTGRPNQADDRTAAASSMTYCGLSCGLSRCWQLLRKVTITLLVFVRLSFSVNPVH